MMTSVQSVMLAAWTAINFPFSPLTSQDLVELQLYCVVSTDWPQESPGYRLQVRLPFEKQAEALIKLRRHHLLINAG